MEVIHFPVSLRRETGRDPSMASAWLRVVAEITSDRRVEGCICFLGIRSWNLLHSKFPWVAGPFDY